MHRHEKPAPAVEVTAPISGACVRGLIVGDTVPLLTARRDCAEIKMQFSVARVFRLPLTAITHSTDRYLKRQTTHTAGPRFHSFHAPPTPPPTPLLRAFKRQHCRQLHPCGPICYPRVRLINGECWDCQFYWPRVGLFWAVKSFSTRLLSSCTDEYANTYDISTY